MRLDKFLTHATGLTRSQAQRAIRRGEVLVEGAVLKDPSAAVAETARVEHAGRPLALPAGHHYFMLNKPAGYVCATEDRQHRSVLELIDLPNRRGLHIAGRLDLDATGLVLITDDGAWSHRVTSPRHEIPKSYLVRLKEPLAEEAVAMLEQGIQLREEKHPCAPARVERLAVQDVRVTITEGKYHQVKRMFAAVGNHVLALHRERIGSLVLDPALPPGAARALTAEEVSGFV